jgi:hypothetical protein
VYASRMRIARLLLPLLLVSACWQAYGGSLAVPPAVLARVRAAHRIFVSNAGESDSAITTTVNGWGYLNLYQQLAGWPGVQLVGSPAQADLIFQVYVDSSQGYFDKEPTFTERVTILDPATQQVLWANDAEFGRIKSALKPIAPTKPAPHASNKSPLLPAQLKNPKKLFIVLPPLPQPPGVTEAGSAFSQAIAKSGDYTLVDRADQADLILSVAIDESPVFRGKNSPPILGSIRVSILDPGTKTILWTFENQFVFRVKIILEQQIPETMPYIVKSWTGLIGKDAFVCHSFGGCQMK